MTGKKRIGSEALLLIGAALILGLLPALAGGYLISLLTIIFIWITMAESWAIFSGLSGYISLGHIVFSGLGMYAAALAARSFHLPFTFILSGIVAFLFALAIGYPALRVRGPYFAILMFGISEAVSVSINYYMTTVHKVETIVLPLMSPISLYYYFLALALTSVLAMYFIKRAKLGRALLGIKEDEDAAETIGINTIKYKLLGFAISALFAGLVGGGLAFYRGFFETTGAFNPLGSFQSAIMAMLGGGNEVCGPVLGAIILTLLSEIFGVTYPHHYLLVTGILLIFIVKLTPSGLLPLIREVVSFHVKKV
jgi:branched-chain amino acid transport system permease protein